MSIRIIDVREVTKPIASPIRNAYIDFTKMTTSLVAVVTDVVRNGERVVGYGFNSNGRYGQGGLIRERFAPRLLEAEPKSLLDSTGENLDPDKVWAAMMINEKPGGHGERSVAVGTLDMAVWTRSPRSRASLCSGCWPNGMAGPLIPGSSSTPPAATTIRARISACCAGRCAAISIAATAW